MFYWSTFNVKLRILQNLLLVSDNIVEGSQPDDESFIVEIFGIFEEIFGGLVQPHPVELNIHISVLSFLTGILLNGTNLNYFGPTFYRLSRGFITSIVTSDFERAFLISS